MTTKHFQIKTAKLIIIIVILLNVIHGVTFGGAIPILEYGHVNNSSDGVSPSAGPFYLYVLGQPNKTFSGIVGQLDGAPIPDPNMWSGVIWFGDGSGPDAGETHVVVTEKAATNNVGYYSINSKTLTSGDIANPLGVSFVTVNLTKMTAPTGNGGSNLVNLSITHVTPNVNPNDIWGYRVYQSVDGGAYAEVSQISSVSTSDVSALQAGSFTVPASPNHSYQYKYKVIFRNREYLSTYYSDNTSSIQPVTANNYIEAPSTTMNHSVASGNNMYIISIPYNLESIGFTTSNARNLMDKLNRMGEGGSNGQYVTQVLQFIPSQNAFNSYIYSQQIEALTGNGFAGYNFDLVPGEAYEVKVASTATHNIAGNFPPTFNLSFINTSTNVQFVSLPYDLLGTGKTYETMEDLFKKANDIADVSTATLNDLEVIQIWQLDTINNSWTVAVYNPMFSPPLVGGDTPLVSGYGYVFKLHTLSAPPYIWGPYN